MLNAARAFVATDRILLLHAGNSSDVSATDRFGGQRTAPTPP
jgi:hypothetical protein